MLYKKNLLFLFMIGVFSTITFAQNLEDYKYENGKKIYDATCASCHGDKGETNSKMRLIVNPRKLNKTILSEKESFLIIKEGAHYWGAHSDIMPAFKHVYKDEELDEVTYYISKAFNPDRDARVQKLLEKSEAIPKTQKLDMLVTGKRIFDKHCSMCHGVTGNGKSDYVEKSKAEKNFIYPYNLTRTLLSEEEIFLYAKYGGEFWGTAQDDMPSWKKKYNDFELKSVAKYINENIKKIK